MKYPLKKNQRDKFTLKRPQKTLLLKNKNL